MTHVIETLTYRIVVEANALGGTIESDLKEPCTHCGSTTCNYDCDGSKGADPEHEDDDNRAVYNAAIDGLESLILAQACDGIQMDDNYDAAVGTAIDSITHHYSN
jgi:hypothetical protein